MKLCLSRLQVFLKVAEEADVEEEGIELYKVLRPWHVTRHDGHVNFHTCVSLKSITQSSKNIKPCLYLICWLIQRFCTISVTTEKNHRGKLRSTAPLDLTGFVFTGVSNSVFFLFC